MDIFYSDYDSNSPISTGRKHLEAAVARLLLSMLKSLKYMSDAHVAAFLKVVNVKNFWTLCVILAGWMISIRIGGPVATAVSAILFYLGVRDFYDKLGEIYTPLKDWLTIAYHAKNDADLESAAKNFATGFANGGVTIIEYIVLNKLFRATELLVTKRLPAPGWIKDTWDRAMSERKAEPSAKKRADDEAQTAVQQLVGGLQVKGAIRAAGGTGFPVAVAVVGGVAVTTIGVLAAVALSSKGKRS